MREGDVLIRDPLADLPSVDLFNEVPVDKEVYERARRRCAELARERDEYRHETENLRQQFDAEEDEREADQHALRQQASQIEMLTEKVEMLTRVNEDLRINTDRLVTWGREEQERHRDTKRALMISIQDQEDHRDPEDTIDINVPLFSRECPSDTYDSM